MNLQAEEVMHLLVKLGETLHVGENAEGYLRVIPIVGGEFEGSQFRGKILSGGADWNVEVNPHYTHVHAVYCIQEVDGTIISVDNSGYIDFGEERMIRTVPHFTVRSDNEKYKMLQTGVFVGELDASRSEEGIIDIRVYKMA